MQLLCVVSQKASASGGLLGLHHWTPLVNFVPHTLYRGSAQTLLGDFVSRGDFVPQTLYTRAPPLDPTGGLPSSRLLLCPPNNTATV